MRRWPRSTRDSQPLLAVRRDSLSRWRCCDEAKGDNGKSVSSATHLQRGSGPTQEIEDRPPHPRRRWTSREYVHAGDPVREEVSSRGGYHALWSRLMASARREARGAQAVHPPCSGASVGTGRRATWRSRRPLRSRLARPDRRRWRQAGANRWGNGNRGDAPHHRRCRRPPRRSEPRMLRR